MTAKNRMTERGEAIKGPGTNVSPGRPPSLRTPEATVLDAFTAATAGLRAEPVLSASGPLISVLILTLDGRELLDRLFSSFEAVNGYQAIEFIVVDHGSVDGTLDCLRQWARRGNRDRPR